MEFIFTLVVLALAFTPFVVLLVAKSPDARLEKRMEKSATARRSASRMAHRRTRERVAGTQDGAAPIPSPMDAGGVTRAPARLRRLRSSARPKLHRRPEGRRWQRRKAA
ncbi:hypothetical protein [Arthrobacter sp. Marseille-P9274]|uniref:hypothetical protein n=1 Tax=Arthrobacter sp. Marseille-P9274 TaxID=2866572 RepID=UPI0021C79C78|nr:hypothetical protein [Arthrobacter sp. Marseille-P9274]